MISDKINIVLKMDTSATVYAISILNPDGGSGVNGVVKLASTGGKTRIQARLTGLTGSTPDPL